MGGRRLAQMWEELRDTKDQKVCPQQAAGHLACSAEAALPRQLPGGDLTDREMRLHGGYPGAIAARGVVVPSSLCCEAPVAAIEPGLIY